MVPLDRALQSSYSNHSTISNGLAANCNANFDWDFDPKSPHLAGTGAHGCAMLLATTPVSLLNGISFRPVALAGCMIVTDRQRDGPRADTFVAIGRIADAFSNAA